MGLLFLNNGWTRGCLVIYRQKQHIFIHPDYKRVHGSVLMRILLNERWMNTEGLRLPPRWLFSYCFRGPSEDHEFCVIALPDPGSRQLEVVCRYVWSYSAHRLVLMRLFDAVLMILASSCIRLNIFCRTPVNKNLQETAIRCLFSFPGSSEGIHPQCTESYKF